MNHTSLNIKGDGFVTLGSHIDRLLDDETGCPWDRKQTLETLGPMLREEADELIDAIKRNDVENIVEESGDVLLLVFMILAKLKAGHNDIDPNDATQGVIEKIIRRHTWIFGADADKVKTPEDAERIWAENKKKEKERMS